MKTKLSLLALIITTLVVALSLPTWAINNNPNLLWKSPSGPAIYRFGFYVEERANLRDGIDNVNGLRQAYRPLAMATSNMGHLYDRVLEQTQGQWVVIGLELNGNQTVYVDGPGALEIVGMFNGGRDSLMVDAEIMVSKDPQQREVLSSYQGQIRVEKDFYHQKSDFNGGKKLVVIYVHLLNCQSVQEITEVRPTAKWREG